MLSIIYPHALRFTNAAGGAYAHGDVPFINQSNGNRAEIDESGANHSQRVANPLLVQAIVRAHNWLKSLSDGTYSSIEDLARRLDLHPKVIRKGLRLAFLSPTITNGVLIGEQRGARLLRDLDEAVALSWHAQSGTLYPKLS